MLLALALLLSADLAIFDVAPAHAQANVTIAPTRLVFEDRDRSAELVLLNRGDQPITYRISLIAMHMSDDGRLQTVEEAVDGQLLAHDLLRFAPRQVRLEPGVAQRVRVMVRKPADLPEGEYRSHLLFQAVPDAPAEPDDGIEAGQLALRLNIISGLSIATIVRHGNLSARMSIDDLELVEADDREEASHITFQLRRDGDRSVYGDIAATFVPNESEEPVVVGQHRGAAVYTPNSTRDVQMALTLPDDLPLRDGRIIVTYHERSEDGGALLASQELILP